MQPLCSFIINQISSFFHFSSTMIYSMLLIALAVASSAPITHDDSNSKYPARQGVKRTSMEQTSVPSVFGRRAEDGAIHETR
jgi:hypothetical protein